MDLKEKVLNIIQSNKASYRQAAYERAGISTTDLHSTIDSLVADGLLKRNKRGAVSLVSGPNQAAARRARIFDSSQNPFNT